ncbi:hypothetical protein BJ875DRAFT_503157 [Amylocarpus encephaloides]|uniref:Zona occludens toxin N-terminal domain-containing protein n=1 Tax=Amylocarpus encephaloides TaxID=45428 RepID=A0A9P7YN67_9HELO|nr:hypothetical protein BJ875DRAFT_503157 [Amylocarpus encephaloides]
MLLSQDPKAQELREAVAAPMFTFEVLQHIKSDAPTNAISPIPQYGLLAGLVQDPKNDSLQEENSSEPIDRRLFFNISSPSSTFICGSQGSGKSHTLSCMLENALFPSDVSKLPHPLAGIVFHYDTFISDVRGSPCEAAFLASNQDIKVKVLCAPTNVATIKKIYDGMGVEIIPLRIGQKHLNTKRMLDLMAVKQDDGLLPLYLYKVKSILREMRLEQQEKMSRRVLSEATFDYGSFKRRILGSHLTPAQVAPLEQRLETLESFMPPQQVISFGVRGNSSTQGLGCDWTPKANFVGQPGHLTIVDLSCPCMSPQDACALFNICLGIFMEQGLKVGLVVALDEAHKYMDTSAEASSLTETLLSTVRLQRHLGTRIIVSTQEPTVSPALIDLSSVTIVHRFTSPTWLKTLEEHLAGASSILLEEENDSETKTKGNVAKKIFSEIVKLRVGEALLFSPSAVVELETAEDGSRQLKGMGGGYLKIRTRARLTTDGGKSEMAS